jgi:CDGSH-type Zn-finger protein
LAALACLASLNRIKKKLFTHLYQTHYSFLYFLKIKPDNIKKNYTITEILVKIYFKLQEGQKMCKDAIVFHNKPKGVKLEAGVEYLICSCGRSKDGIFCDGSHEGSGCLPKSVTVEKTKPYLICLCKTSGFFPFCDGTHSLYKDTDVKQNVKEWHLK